MSDSTGKHVETLTVGKEKIKAGIGYPLVTQESAVERKRIFGID